MKPILKKPTKSEKILPNEAQTEKNPEGEIMSNGAEALTALTIESAFKLSRVR